MENVFNKAHRFILENGTELQKSCLNYLLGKEPKENLVMALQKYQNNDGGWAHGLEIEYQGTLSSVMTTAAALAYLYLFDLGDTPLFESTLEYLKAKQNDSGCWDDGNELKVFQLPPYYLPGSYVEYKTGMILKWLRRLAIDQEMVARGYQFLLERYNDSLKSEDIWTAIAYSNAFADYPHQKSEEIIERALKILMKQSDMKETDGLSWMRVQGMIYEDNKMLESIKEQVLDLIKTHQLEKGGWPHQFGTYNQVWAAVLILRFLIIAKE